jgi:hypothetical protein
MKSLRKAPALAVLVGVSQLTCHQVILTAPPGSTMTCQANPPFIAANGDVAIVSALIFDATGSPVADGTVVQFFTNLGRIPEQAKTNDGVARVNFTSDTRSGKASILIFSGGQGGATTSSTTGTTVTTGPAAGSGSEVSAFASGSSASAFAVLANCPPVEVIIGSARPKLIRVTAFPPRLLESRTSEIVANVFDEFGNPVANVPLIFRSENASLGFIESGGVQKFTDNNGRASDVFRTRLSRDAGTLPAKIDVLGPNNLAGDVTVYIN